MALKHLAQLDRVAEYDRSQSRFDIADSRRMDVTMGYAFRLLASRDIQAEVDDAAVKELAAEGLTATDVEHVAFNLHGLRRNDMHRESRGRLEALLATVGAAPSPINLGIAQTTTHLAMAMALLDARATLGRERCRRQSPMGRLLHGRTASGP